MKQRIFLHKYLQICNLKGFQAIRQKVTWFSKYEKTFLNPFANWSFNCRWKKSVSFYNKEFHFLFLDTNRQYKSYEKFWSHDFFYLCCHQKPCKPIWWIISSSCDLCVCLLKNPLCTIYKNWFMLGSINHLTIIDFLLNFLGFSIVCGYFSTKCEKWWNEGFAIIKDQFMSF